MNNAFIERLTEELSHPKRALKRLRDHKREATSATGLRERKKESAKMFKAH